MKKHYKIISFVIFFVVLDLCLTVNIKDFLYQFGPLKMLRTNLLFIQSIVSKIPAILIILIIWVLLLTQIRLNFTKITLAGIEISNNRSDQIIKKRISNYLNTKRSLFVFIREYDNYYDCIKSYYEIYNFLREELTSFNDADNGQNECYQQIQYMIGKINTFLTKYQSNYRSWYEYQLKLIDKGANYRSPFELQNEYDSAHNNILCSAFNKMNSEMTTCPTPQGPIKVSPKDFFNVNLDKWNELKNSANQTQNTP